MYSGADAATGYAGGALYREVDAMTGGEPNTAPTPRTAGLNSQLPPTGVWKPYAVSTRLTGRWRIK